MTILIGLTGKAGSGKDTVANYLKANYNFRSVAFAAALKDGVKVMFGLDDAHLDHPLKEQQLPDIGKSPRQLMQLLGTEYGRELIHQDLWLILAAKKVKQYQESGYNVALTDVRFENEAKMVRDAGGIVVHVERDTAGTKFTHPSEAGVAKQMTDHLLDNNGSLEDLYKQVDTIMEYIKSV